MELGEKLYPTTDVEGRETIKTQLQELQQALEALFDGISSTERELKTKLSRSVVILLRILMSLQVESL